MSEFKPMTLEELDSINLYCHCDDSRLCNQHKCRLLETCRAALKVVRHAKYVVEDDGRSGEYSDGVLWELEESLKPFRSEDSNG